MATRSHSTFKKRQKEQARQEKQQDKMARRLQKKLDKQNGVSSGPEIGPAEDYLPDDGFEPETDPFSSLPVHDSVQ